MDGMTLRILRVSNGFLVTDAQHGDMHIMGYRHMAVATDAESLCKIVEEWATTPDDGPAVAKAA